MTTATATKKKARNCVKGKPCGGTCVSQASNCKSDKEKPEAVTKPKAKKSTTTRMTKKGVAGILEAKGYSLKGVSGNYKVIKEGKEIGKAKTLTDAVGIAARNDLNMKPEPEKELAKKPEPKKELAKKPTATPPKLDKTGLEFEQELVIATIEKYGYKVEGKKGDFHLFKDGIEVAVTANTEELVQGVHRYTMYQVKTNPSITHRELKHPKNFLGLQKQTLTDNLGNIQENGKGIMDSLKLDVIPLDKDKTLLDIAKEKEELKKKLKNDGNQITGGGLIRYRIAMLDANKREREDEILNHNEKELKKVTDLLKKNSSVSLESSKAYADWVTLEGMTPGQTQKYREWLVEFDQMTDGKARDTMRKVFVSPEKPRAYANRGQFIINMGDQNRTDEELKTVFFHELGHHLEYSSKGMGNTNKSYIRANADTSEPQKLSKITGNPRYKDTEVAYPGKFINPYVSKDYGKASDSTEVFAMGIQQFADKAGFTATMSHPHGKAFLEYTLGNLLNNYEANN